MNSRVEQYRKILQKAEQYLQGGIGQIPQRPDLQVGHRYLSEKCKAFLKFQGEAIGEASLYGNYLCERIEQNDLDARQIRLAESMLGVIITATDKLASGIAAVGAKIANVNATKGRLDTNYDLDLLEHFKEHDEIRAEMSDSLIGARAYVGAMRNPELANTADVELDSGKVGPSMKTVARYVSCRQGLQKAIERLHGAKVTDQSTVTMVSTVTAALRASDRLFNLMSSGQDNGLKREVGLRMESHLAALEQTAPFLERLFDGNSADLSAHLQRLTDSTRSANAFLADRVPAEPTLSV